MCYLSSDEPHSVFSTDALRYYCILISLFSKHPYSSQSKNLKGWYLQNIVIQADQARLAENQVEILERLGHPEALALVELERHLALGHRDISNSRVREFRHGGVLDGFKHAPGRVLQRRVARDAVEDEDGFDGFGAVWYMLEKRL